MSIEKTLASHRNRLVLRAFLRSLVLTLTVALPIIAIGLAANRHADLGMSDTALVLVPLAGALVVAAILTALGDRSLLGTARHLEALDPELHSRLSTALELKQANRTDSPISRAQISDATARAKLLNPAERISLGLPPLLRNGLLASIVVLAIGLYLGSPANTGPDGNSLTVDTLPYNFSEEELSSITTNIQQLAEIFSDAGDDPYLQAISRQLQELGRQLETSAITRSETATELERLLQHTETALTMRDGTTPSNIALEELPDLLEAALDNINHSYMADAPKTEQSEDMLASANMGAAEPGIEQQGNIEAPMTTTGDTSQTGDQSAMSESGAHGSTTENATSHGNYYDYAIDERTLAELNARALDSAATSAGETIGASPESQAGASSMAGAGTDELFGSEDAERLNAERLENMEVPDEADPEGRHVRIEVTPETELTEVRMSPLGEISWNRQTEPDVEREALNTSQRLVTARFHTPEQDE